ncbi:glycosyltransferase [uncultured Enterovirga sp.]|uniref:glycosyltransferase family 2 protein n=1 Tax=uncultured Enterovirga sp. TaxID=2026352 RepID=UPI0035CB9F15
MTAEGPTNSRDSSEEIGRIVQLAGVFDADWYKTSYLPEGAEPSDLLADLVADRPDRAAHPLFDRNWYLAQNPDVAAAGMPPFLHFLEHGLDEGRSPHPLFDPDLFAALNPGQSDSPPTLIRRFMTSWRDRVTHHPLLDSDWYLSAYPDVAAAGDSATLHYLRHGFLEGRNPHPLFDWGYYRDRARLAGGVDPLLHYLASDPSEEVSPCPMFDLQWYRDGNPDLPAQKLFLQFVCFGDREGRSPHQLFDPSYYARGVEPSPERPLHHYATEGGRQGRNPHPVFDAAHFSTMHADVLDPHRDLLSQYLRLDRPHRRHPHPLVDSEYQGTLTHLVQRTADDPLVEYVLFRSNLDPALVNAHATGIPTPRRAILPSRSVDRPPPSSEPLVSILVPAYNSPETHFRRAIDSIRSQTYSHWEIIIVDDGSSAPHMEAMLSRLSLIDPRIQVDRLPRNVGISAATNHALGLASGDFVALLDHDDVLLPDALGRVVATLLDEQADICFTDQSYVSEWGTFDGTFFKPDWSPVFLTGVMYIGHLLVVRRQLAESVGGFDQSFDRVQDFEFMLRLSELKPRVAHVREMLYQWRRIPGSIAFDASSKGRIEPLQAAAVNAHLDRTGFAGRASPHPTLPHRLTIAPTGRGERPTIDVVAYRRPQDEVMDWLDGIAGARVAAGSDASGRPIGLKLGRDASVAPPAVAPDLSQLCSRGSGSYILFVGPGLEPSNARWLDYLLMYADLPDVLSVAASIFDADGRCVISGSTLDPKAGLRPLMAGWALGMDGYAGSLACDREVTASHGSAILIKRRAFEDLGGLDRLFQSPYYAFGEMMLRGVEAGYRNINIATPLFGLTTNNVDLFTRDPGDRLHFLDLHRELIGRGDRYYSSNFQAGRDYDA